jgi:hypothetical protein
MIITSSLHLDQVPGESFLISCLQKNMNFSINNRTIKRGKLLLFRRFHYNVQLTMTTERGVRENVDIPLPFRIEDYQREGLMYYDYRLDSLEVARLPRLPEKVSSLYFDKILEIQVLG